MVETVSRMGEMGAEEIVALCRRYTIYEWSAQDAIDPIPVVRAKGVYFWDARGRRYLDFNSQLMNVNIGHGDERVIRAIQEQAARLPYVNPFMATEPRARLGQMLAEIAPGDLNKVFFTLGGADANENAIKIARLYTGRHKIIARYRSYHGATAGAITLTGDPRRWPAEPGIPGVIHVFDPYRYRCRWCMREARCTLDCLNHIEDVIQFEGPHTVAAVFIETVTGTNGIIIPPDGYLQGLREICHRYGILLICDEVMSGFGRTGEWFAVNHWNVVPDLMTVAKGLTSGYLPLGAVLMAERIAEFFRERPFPGGLTYNSHPLCLAAAIATLQVYQEDHLIENARRMGEILARELARLKERHPSVGDVRSIGLFGVIELVRNRETREPLVPFNARPSEMGIMNRLREFFLQNGLYTFIRWNTFFTNPPLCITEEELMEGIEIIDRGLEITDDAVV
ncbi:aminotransferase class III-fold pyridoxal phosphate-dependent enzyme [Thermoflexus sp.]|uniref:aminotransferase class III-fold pyridoxal phosphate-dependent enzyme n=1 Tax=Thermoflexus sp. TaxID=1969742 RepID=UPI002ADD9A73|nr:aminotransferase class III-fold pyridoxal phosphate-dependent enzyme [Thermoflexus sp.]